MRKRSDSNNVLSVRKQQCFICAKATMFYLCESEATATMFYLCESEATATMFYLCESEATATNVLSVRKRSDSNKCFICAKAKRQQQQSAQPERKSTIRYGDES
ncbi:hypothetical protein [Lysinibacillus sp. NPDC056232]|uniref:hypothetical protein n=1 Tax=Lysinibacillus sp. NPDC056232 TaxID=3345756 RepID=UPI0035D73619